eukprot:TRINITY_DN27060_c0_g1_i1.p1 TRINITY_DN27060_c0_g1~~TRINITY_DN27060_c0_g1_i1.p1  ORF type:complete len:1268 (-),score=397.75 TRINITY_DN27060_c0_g1_i1:68-3871(-)
MDSTDAGENRSMSASRLLVQELAAPAPASTAAGQREACGSSSGEQGTSTLDHDLRTGKRLLQVSQVVAAAKRAIQQGKKALKHQVSAADEGSRDAASSVEGRAEELEASTAPPEATVGESLVGTNAQSSDAAEETLRTQAELVEPESFDPASSSQAPPGGAMAEPRAVVVALPPDSRSEVAALPSLPDSQEKRRRQRDLEAERRALEVERDFDLAVQHHQAEAQRAEARYRQLEDEQAAVSAIEGILELKQEAASVRLAAKRADMMARQRAGSQREARRKAQQALDASKAELAELVKSRDETAKGERQAIQRMKRQLVKMQQRRARASAQAQELTAGCKMKDSDIAAAAAQLETSRMKVSEIRGLASLLQSRVQEAADAKEATSPTSNSDVNLASVAQRVAEMQQAGLNAEVAEAVERCRALELQELSAISQMDKAEMDVERFRAKLLRRSLNPGEIEEDDGDEDLFDSEYEAPSSADQRKGRQRGQQKGHQKGSQKGTKSKSGKSLASKARRSTAQRELKVEQMEALTMRHQLNFLKEEVAEAEAAKAIRQDEKQQDMASELSQACEQLLGACSLGQRDLEELSVALKDQDSKKHEVQPSLPEHPGGLAVEELESQADVEASWAAHRRSAQISRARQLEVVCLAEQKLSQLELSHVETEASRRAENARKAEVEKGLAQLRHHQGKSSLVSGSMQSNDAELTSFSTLLEGTPGAKATGSKTHADDTEVLHAQKQHQSFVALCSQLEVLQPDFAQQMSGGVSSGATSREELDVLANRLLQSVEQRAQHAADIVKSWRSKLLHQEAVVDRATKDAAEASAAAMGTQQLLPPEALAATGSLEAKRTSLEQSCAALEALVAAGAAEAAACQRDHASELQQSATLRSQLAEALQAESAARLELCAGLEAEAEELAQSAVSLDVRSHEVVAECTATEATLESEAAASHWVASRLLSMSLADEELEAQYQQLASRAAGVSKACAREQDLLDLLHTELTTSVRSDGDSEVAFIAETAAFAAAKASLRSEMAACVAVQSVLDSEEMKAQQAQVPPPNLPMEAWWPKAVAAAQAAGRGCHPFAVIEEEIQIESAAAAALDDETSRATIEEQQSLAELALAHEEAQELRSRADTAEAAVAEEQVRRKVQLDAAMAEDAETIPLAQQLHKLEEDTFACEKDIGQLQAAADTARRQLLSLSASSTSADRGPGVRLAPPTSCSFLQQEVWRQEADAAVEAEALRAVTTRATLEAAACTAMQQRLMAVKAELSMSQASHGQS